FAVIGAVRYGPEWQTNIDIPETNICKDIAGGSLPAFSWVIPDQVDSDHPHSKTQEDDGPDWIASVVNAIGNSQYWDSTAIIILWDDWGGFYDNVSPKFHASGSLGFRVPALIVSPYVAQGKIAHADFEFGSILKFAEETFGLPSLGTTDKRATSIGQVFNFNQAPRSFVSIPTSRSCSYFIHRKPSYLPVDTE
ncbi:MAG TPA: alkaline phosphatase family protein, partial [Candidatus Tumulicola sp.]|nr:alkaline phosphatase family protein [Candidatus Tumulicola sp.]